MILNMITSMRTIKNNILLIYRRIAIQKSLIERTDDHNVWFKISKVYIQIDKSFIYCKRNIVTIMIRHKDDKTV